MTCQICNNESNNTTHTIREMMFGLREPFEYLECSACGTVQIIDIPTDMERHYPSNYYSLNDRPDDIYSNPFRAYLERARIRYAVFGTGVIGRFMNMRYPDGAPTSLSYLRDISIDARILDVGCGSGSLLYALREIGFVHTYGTDPYINEPITYANGLTIQSNMIQEVTGTFDIIMLHHVYEHIENPLAFLKELKKKLSDTGTIIIRIPIADSEAWEKYETDWVQLDAPRHFFLHTVEGMHTLAKAAGLMIDDIVYDSRDFQFWGSEQYKRDIPLMDEQSLAVNTSLTLFTKQERKTWKAAAIALNETARGDQACFYIKKK